ncbi:MAG: 2,4-diaminopentanoate dehydrogenase [Chromatiales bacterium]|jgi:4-hydroxy-tetrahydrodipicolinate reductase
MQQAIRVLLLGTGQMGSGIARLALKKTGLQLVGAFARRAGRSGKDLGPLIGLEKQLGILVQHELSAVIEQTRPQIAIQATCSRLRDAREEIQTLLRQGVNVISIAEELAYPASASAAIADELRNLALAQRVALLGTGVNPGFVLDLLVIALTGVCAEVNSIQASRVNDLAPYGPTVLDSQGVGLTPSAFARGLEAGTVVGHFGFAQSIAMIGHALGWEIERVEQTRRPIISQVRRTTPFVTVEPGQVAGCHHRAVAFRQDRPVITLDHPQQIQPQLEGIATGDRIEIGGIPDIAIAGSPEIPGGVATEALAVNMIPRLLNAPPGLYSMADLPVPAALLGDARRLLKEQEDG